MKKNDYYTEKDLRAYFALHDNEPLPEIRFSPEDIVSLWRNDPDNYTSILNEYEVQLYATHMNRLDDFGENYAETFNKE